MKIIIATGEPQIVCICKALQKAGHEICGIIFPESSVFNQGGRRARYFLFNVQFGKLTSLLQTRTLPHRIEPNLTDGSLNLWIRDLKPDLLLVFSWPRIIPDSFLDQFRLGAMNIHPSVLPRLRGQDPIFSAVLNDEPGFGITFHKLDSGLDSGSIYLQKPLRRRHFEHYEKLYFRFLNSAKDLVPLALRDLQQNPKGRPQQGTPTWATKFKQEHTLFYLEDDPNDVVRKTLACRYHHKMRTLCGKTLLYFRTCSEVKTRGDFSPVPRVLAVRPWSIVLHHHYSLLKLRGVFIPGYQAMHSGIKLLQDVRKGDTIAGLKDTKDHIRTHKE